jgi:hypothetical protein
LGYTFYLGTFEEVWQSQVLVDQGHPQYIVVFLKALSLRKDPHSKVKSSLDKLFHPAKIEPDLPTFK